ncbi:hypothetical protein BC443_10625 [Salinicola sp. MIT1003]|nr:hypothetical protein BC443_10625 [Salinicola sp. MIT1003]
MLRSEVSPGRCRQCHEQLGFIIAELMHGQCLNLIAGHTWSPSGHAGQRYTFHVRTFGEEPAERHAGYMALDNVAAHLEGMAASESMWNSETRFGITETRCFYYLDFNATLLQIFPISCTTAAGRAFIKYGFIGQRGVCELSTQCECCG